MSPEEISVRRQQILQELGTLEQFRHGRVEEHRMARSAGGTEVQSEPYYLYIPQAKGRSKSRRLSDQQEVVRYRGQVENFRRFQELIKELTILGERLCDLNTES
jgi:hypothetical protein